MANLASVGTFSVNHVEWWFSVVSVIQYSCGLWMTLYWQNSKLGFMIRIFLSTMRYKRWWLIRKGFSIIKVVKERKFYMKRHHGNHFLCCFPAVKVKQWSRQHSITHRSLVLSGSHTFSRTHTTQTFYFFVYPPTHNLVQMLDGPEESTFQPLFLLHVNDPHCALGLTWLSAFG